MPAPGSPSSMGLGYKSAGKKRTKSTSGLGGYLFAKKIERKTSDHAGLSDDAIAEFEASSMMKAEKEQMDPLILHMNGEYYHNIWYRWSIESGSGSTSGKKKKGDPIIVTDKFWGLDFEKNRCDNECADMACEFLASAKYEAHCRHVLQVLEWNNEEKQSQYVKAYDLAVIEAKARRQYIKYLHEATTTKEIMSFKWPTKPCVAPAPMPKMGKDSLAWDSYAIGGVPQLAGSQAVNDQYLDSIIFGIVQIDHNSSSVVHADGLQRSKLISAQYEDDAELAASVLKGRNIGVSIAERAMYPDVPPADSSHGGGLEASLGIRMTKLKKRNKVKETNVKDQSTLEGPQLNVVGQGPSHNEELDGHPVYKWDQEMILRAAFTAMDVEQKGKLILSDFINSLNTEAVVYLLRFTVFGAWVKLRQWHMFETIFEGANDSEDHFSDDGRSVQESLSADDFIVAAELRLGRRVSSPSTSVRSKSTRM